MSKQSVFGYLKLAKAKLRSELQKKMKKSDPLYGIAAIPMGPLLTEVLHREAAEFSAEDKLWTERAIERCGAYISKKPPVRPGGIFIKKRIAMIAGAALSFVAIAVVTTIIAIGGQSSDLLNSRAPESEAVGTVIFTSNHERYSHLNPTHAEIRTDSTYGKLTVQEWEIMQADKSEAVYKGTGEFKDEVLIQMKENNEDGEYWLVIRLKDSKDSMYSLSRSFLIRTEDNT